MVVRSALRRRRARRYLARRVTWNRLYRTTSYLKSALWTVPIISIALVFATAPILRWVDRWLDWELAGLAPSGAQALCQTVITLTLSFVVFTFGSLLVAIQVAGGQYTPRIIATTLLKDNVIRFTVGCFVFTMVFALRVLSRMDERVHQFNTFIAVTLGAFSIMVFLYLIDHAARFLRPVSIVAKVGQFGSAVIESV